MKKLRIEYSQNKAFTAGRIIRIHEITCLDEYEAIKEIMNSGFFIKLSAHDKVFIPPHKIEIIHVEIK